MCNTRDKVALYSECCTITSTTYCAKGNSLLFKANRYLRLRRAARKKAEDPLRPEESDTRGAPRERERDEDAEMERATALSILTENREKGDKKRVLLSF